MTWIHDGTVVMTGDYGVLAWRREYFPEFPDMYFPAERDCISYFAEKVCTFGIPFRIKDWKWKRAEKPLMKYLKETYLDEDDYGDDTKKRVRRFIKDGHGYEDTNFGMHEMLNDLYELDCYGYWTDMEIFGEEYSNDFVYRFELVKHCISLVKKEGVVLWEDE